MSKANIFIHVTGSISAYKAAALVSMLKKQDYAVRCSITPSGLDFLGEATLVGLSQEPVRTTEECYSVMDHIVIPQQWADLMLVYPASANTINRLAAGLADDFFGAAFLANDFLVPVWLAPAMNSRMFAHPATQEGLEKLNGWGVNVLPTVEGKMACGSTGWGRLLEPQEVFQRIEEARSANKLGPKLERHS